MVMPEGIVGDCFSILASTKVALVMPEKSDNLCVCGAGGGGGGGVGAWWSQGKFEVNCSRQMGQHKKKIGQSAVWWRWGSL